MLTDLYITIHYLPGLEKMYLLTSASSSLVANLESKAKSPVHKAHSGREGS